MYREVAVSKLVSLAGSSGLIWPVGQAADQLWSQKCAVTFTGGGRCHYSSRSNGSPRKEGACWAGKFALVRRLKQEAISDLLDWYLSPAQL